MERLKLEEKHFIAIIWICEKVEMCNNLVLEESKANCPSVFASSLITGFCSSG